MSRPVAILLTALLCVPAWSTPVTAGDLRQLADEPLAIMFARDIDEANVAEYVEGLSGRMSIGKRTSKQIRSQLDQIVVTESRDPVIGQLYYLVQGLVPSVEQISFRSVVDEPEAKKLVDSRRKLFGGSATLEEDGNGLYRIVRYNEYESEIQPDQEVQEYENEGPGYHNRLEIVERDGKRYQKQSWQFTQQYRYHDRFLYSNHAADFSSVNLPTAQEIYDSLDANSDFGVRIYPDRVPPALRTMGWNMLNAMVGTQLQQRDSEGGEWSQLRSTAGTWGLSLLKAFMFDVDYGEGKGHLASGREPIRGQFNLRPRRNSGLIKQLDELGSGRSRFAPLLRDDAAVSFHACVALPDEGQETVTALARWVEAEAGSSGYDRDTEAGYRSLAQALDDVAHGGTVEVMVRLVHSDASGSVLLAGIQLRDQPDQVRHMTSVVKHFTGQLGDLPVETTQRHGRPLVHVQIPMSDDDPVRISDLWIAQRNGCLWLAAGGEHAHEMIRLAAERCGDGGRAVRTRLLTARIDLAHWMTWPKKDPTGLATLPEWVDAGQFMDLSRSFAGMESVHPTPLLSRVLASRGDKEAWLTVEAGKSGLTAEAELGAPLADWFLARQIDLQDKRTEMREKQQKEAEERAKKEAEKAQQAESE